MILQTYYWIKCYIYWKESICTPFKITSMKQNNLLYNIAKDISKLIKKICIYKVHACSSLVLCVLFNIKIEQDTQAYLHKLKLHSYIYKGLCPKN